MSRKDVKDNLYWGIAGNPFDGFQVVNKATGTCMSLANITNGTGVELAAATGANTYFDLVRNNGNWYVKKHGTENGYVQDYQGKNNAQLKAWNSAANIGDNGAMFVFATTDAAGDLNAANIPNGTSSTYVGGYDFASAAASSLTGKELFDTFRAKLEAGAYYKIRCSRTDVPYADTDYRWISTEVTDKGQKVYLK